MAGYEDAPLQLCELCGWHKFLIWVKWGIWYAACESCGNEYGLFPKEIFRLLREPSVEPEMRLPPTDR